MDNREVESSSHGISFNYKQYPSGKVREVSLNIGGCCILAGYAGLGLAAFYFSSPEAKVQVATALSNVLERATDKIVDIFRGSLVVKLHCSSSKSFLKFCDDYQSGDLKIRLSDEFSKIGIDEVTLEIENEEEVIKRSEVIR